MYQPAADLVLARTRLDADDAAFVVVRDGKIVASGDDYGVRELLVAVDRIGAELRGASLADKVVGRAVALLAVHAGIRAIDTRVASGAAAALLAAHGIPLHADRIVPHILNRTGTDLCPMEKATLPFEAVAAGIQALRDFIVARRAGVPLAP